jgi:nitrous oxide reductase accessory protein NosL
MPKKPGGQPKNRNAYKHGFYSKYFDPLERRALSKIYVTDMSGEIDILRVNVDRFMQAYTSSLETLDYEERLAGLRAITLAVGRIASLERIRNVANKNLTKYDELEKALEGVPFDDDDDGLDSPFH